MEVMLNVTKLKGYELKRRKKRYGKLNNYL